MHFVFNNSSALSGISSGRGDNMKPPLLEEVARSAGGVVGANHVRPYDWGFRAMD